MSRRVNKGGFNGSKDELDNLKEDIKKVGYDIKDIYKKSNVKIQKPKGDNGEIIRWILISAIVLILIISKVGIPIAIIILIFILILLLYR